jgi:uncharacterized OB-fold protein
MSWLQDAEVSYTKGSKCRCGYMTVAMKVSCPKCGKQMKPADWLDKGMVLSFTYLNAFPEGLLDLHNLALVEIEDGPKMVCWTSGRLKENDIVVITQDDGKYICSPETPLNLKPDQDELKA